jgi:hypothetical protein
MAELVDNFSFPFDDIDDHEYIYINNNDIISESLINVYQNICEIDLNSTATFESETNEREYYLTDTADPDNNVFINTHKNNESLYFTESEFKAKITKNIKNNSSEFSIITINCRSLSANFYKFCAMLDQLNYKFDVIAITETWLDKLDIDSERYSLDNYDMYASSRLNKNGGGVLMYINDKLRHRLVPGMTRCTEDCLETVGAEIILDNDKKVIVGCIYRAPNSDFDYLDNFMNYISSFIRNKCVYLCGDFNIDLLKYNAHTETDMFIERLYSLGLFPLIKKPSRITSHSATLIDNIFTSELEMEINSGLLIEDLSDHLPIFQVTKHPDICKNKDLIFTQKIRRVNSHTTAIFNEKLKNSNWENVLCNNDVNVCYNNFVNRFTQLYNESCPLERQSVKTNTNRKPWMTSSLVIACKKKNYLYTKFLLHKNKDAERKYNTNKNKLLQFCDFVRRNIILTY